MHSEESFDTWITRFYLCFANIVIVLDGYVKIVDSASSYTYTVVSGLENKDCANDKLILSETNSYNSLDCLRMCTRLGNDCNSVFFVENSTQSTCHGCNALYSTLDAGILQTLTGSVYYAKELDYDLQWETSYYILTPEPLNFADSVKICENLSGYPVIINGQEENDFLRNAVTGSIDTLCFWFGLYQPNNTDWIWQASSDVISYTAWNTGEPNGGISENCGALLYFLNYAWVDYSCHGPCRMICEFNRL